jgi:hypothetical protein
VLTRSALALIFSIIRDSLDAFYCRALFMMFFLIANVVYHPIEILRSETNDAVARLPIQNLAIHKFVIDVVRTRAFEFSNPLTDQRSWRNRDRDVDVRFSAADFVKD